MSNGNCISKELLSRILTSDKNGRRGISEILSGANIHMLITDSKNNLVFKTSNLIKLQNPPPLSVGDMNFFKFGQKYYKLSMQKENQYGEIFTIITYEDVSDLVLHIQTQRKDNAALQESLSKLKEDLSIDKRTSLLSQRGFLEVIGGFKYDLDKSNSPFVLAMLDLDNFKKFNDNFGHTEGDKFLSYVGDLLRRSFRKSDAIGRYGGDEFIIALSNCDLFTASEICKRLQSSFYEELSHFPNYSELKGHNFGLSIGITQYDNTLTYEENKIRADKALYFGKIYGKLFGMHCVIPYSDKLEFLHDRGLQGQTITPEDIKSLEKEFGTSTNGSSNELGKNTSKSDDER